MHSGSTSCPHWVCGVSVCVCAHCPDMSCQNCPNPVYQAVTKFTYSQRALLSLSKMGFEGCHQETWQAQAKAKAKPASEQASWHMLLIRLMYVSVYYISHILYTRTAYICNVLVINTELYWLTVMESGPNRWHAVRAYPFRHLCFIWDTDTERHTDTDTYTSTDNYRYIWLPVCRPVGAIRNFCLLLTLLTFFRRPRYGFDCCQYHAYATYALHIRGTARMAYRL